MSYEEMWNFSGGGEILCKKIIKIIRSARRRFHAKLIYNAKNCLKLRSKTTTNPKVELGTTNISHTSTGTRHKQQKISAVNSRGKRELKICDFVRCADYNLVVDGCRAVSSSVCSKESTKDERKESSQKGSVEVLRSNLCMIFVGLVAEEVAETKVSDKGFALHGFDMFALSPSVIN